ncbi:MAG: hypothetical protein IT258_06590 [Saprospiraceae bacterium]|nr:hypothetical protein [Saprospiraceae bacterium]
MKTLPFILALCFATFALNAQEVEMEDVIVAKPSKPATSSKVYESEENMSMGSHNALILVTEVTSEKLVERTWKDFMKDYDGKTKGAKGGDENVTTEASIVGIGGVSSMSIYSRATKNMDGYVELLTWFNLGEEYLDSGRKSQYDEAVKMLMKFAYKVKLEATKIELEDAEKKLKSFENEMDKLKRQNSNYHKDIAEAEKRIETAKENIVKNEEQQADSTQKIDLQKQLLEEIKRRLSDMKGN